MNLYSGWVIAFDRRANCHRLVSTDAVQVLDASGKEIPDCVEVNLEAGWVIVRRSHGGISGCTFEKIHRRGMQVVVCDDEAKLIAAERNR